MKLINVVKKDNEILTRINGTFEEIADNYFHNHDVIKIEILEDDEPFQNEFYHSKYLEIYRADETEIKEFQLHYNIRKKVLFDFFDERESEIRDSGFLRIA